MSLLKLNSPILLTMILPILFFAEASTHNSSTSENEVENLVNCIDSLAIKSCVGKRLEKLMLKLEACGFEKYYLDEPPGRLVGAVLELKKSPLMFRVYFKRISRVEPVNKNRNWNWDLIKKERISSLEVYKDGELIAKYE